MQAELTQQIIQVLGTVLLALVTWGGTELTKFIRQKTEAGQHQDALLLLSEITQTVVARGIQTTSQAAKKAHEDGKLTEEEKDQILKDAVADVKQYLGDKGMKSLKKIVGDGNAEKLIADTIERAVLQAKA